VKKTRQNKRLELRSDSIGTEKALVELGLKVKQAYRDDNQGREPNERQNEPEPFAGHDSRFESNRCRALIYLKGAPREKLIKLIRRWSDLQSKKPHESAISSG
jgi:hypothetical protein